MQNLIETIQLVRQPLDKEFSCLQRALWKIISCGRIKYALMTAVQNI